MSVCVFSRATGAQASFEVNDIDMSLASQLTKELNRTLFGARYSKGVSVAAVGILAFAGCALVGLIMGIPEPSVHDEFSYLLAAETFAQGRLTNPTHPMWTHFETFHVIHQPTYMSKYFPAQGLILALGIVVGGHPIVGAWLSMALMSAAVCWMLHAWLPPRWAFFGGLLTIIHPNIGVGSYWAQGYWGGALSAAGGALLLGGWRSIVRKPRLGYALGIGAGLAILANSRPYEGLILGIPVGLALLAWLLGKEGPVRGVALKRIILPLAVVGVITVSAMGFYNDRVAGSPFRLPYLVHEQAYGMFSYFIWQNLPPEPAYRHAIIREYHAEYELPYYYEKRSLAGFVNLNSAILMMYLLLTGSVFVIPLVGSVRPLLVWCWNHRWGRLALATYVFFVCGLMLETIMSLHYWAPITALFYFFVLQSFRLWRARNYRVGQIVLYAVPLMAVALLAIHLYHERKTHSELAPHLQRARLIRQLSAQEGQHLILVKYGAHHSYDREWIYNAADIDSSKVVWAHDMEAQENCKLIRYFKNRRVWSLMIDRDNAPVTLNPFDPQLCYEAAVPHESASWHLRR
jgi:hypothetical protein